MTEANANAALKLALEALERGETELRWKAITAIKEALAQPEEQHSCDNQEPVALQRDVIVVNLVREGINKHRARELAEHFSKHTTPPQRKPLTDEMIVAGGKALAKLHAESCGLDFDDVWKYYAEDHKADAKAAIEAAHGIKE